MRIAIVAHGRFHAFDLARAMVKRGHRITVFTNYPKWAANKFKMRGVDVRGFWLHGILYRLFHKMSNSGLRWDSSAFLNPIFGRWAARQVRKGDFDVVHAFSGV